MTAFQEWVEENPLRKYRKNNNIGQTELAGIIGVSINTVRNWERGAVRPGTEGWTSLEKLGITNDDWTAWLSQRPGSI